MFVIILIVLGILITLYLYQIPKDEAEEKELKRKQPVIVELIPKGTKANPVECKTSEMISFKVLGYSDYKKENLTELESSNISWCKYCGVGSWGKDSGVKNTYYAPSVEGYRDVWIQYRDSKLRTSSKTKILVKGGE